MPDTLPIDSATSHPYIAGLPLVFGGNVFGWTIDRDQSFTVLDAFYQEGGRMIDTAEGYSNWVPGNKGGESETIIGAWVESRGVRKDIRIATKVGQGGGDQVLRPDRVAVALQGSLDRLRTDYVDLYYAHRDDLTTPLDAVVEAFNTPFQAGRIKEIGASNYEADRLTEIVNLAKASGAQGFTVLQPEYNLASRTSYEGSLQDFCVEHDIAVLPFYALASGFLSGKYTQSTQWEGLPRAYALNQAAQGQGWLILKALRKVAEKHNAKPAQVALAWLRTRAGVAAPIASATTPEQVTELCASARIQLSAEDLDALSPE